MRIHLHHAQTRYEGREGVVRHLGPGSRDRTNERGFPRIGKAQEAHIGDEFELEAQVTYFPRRSLGGAPGRPVHGALKHRVTQAMASPRSYAQGLTGLGEIPKGFKGFLVDHRRAHGHLHERILAPAPGHLPPGARLPRFRSIARLETEIHEGVQGRFGAEDHIAPIAAVATVRAALGQILRPKEGQASVTALARLHANHRLIYELHAAPSSPAAAPRRAKKNPGNRGFFAGPRISGALGLRPRLGLGRLDAHVTALLRPTNLKLHLTIGEGEEGVIPAQANVGAGVELGAALPNEDVPRLSCLASEELNAKTL